MNLRAKDFPKKRLLAVAILAAAIITLPALLKTSRIDYNTQVKPILNKKCISCHGGVKQKAGFSLMTREDALAATESGRPAIVPGNPGASEFIRRIESHDPEERMPYREEPLSKDEISILKQWIKEGAPWGAHWAYLPVEQPAVPKPQPRFFGLISPEKNDWVRNDLDWFILDRLQKEGLQPAPEADKATLLRRVSLDLIGMPAPDTLAKMFLKDSSTHAYARLVDSLLASPRFGERWASVWLDLARYADTKGYERDAARFVWRYRDWLIRAFNADMPYDRFLTEQLAGDLMPNPNDAQYIATTFHRNTMTNDEGGTDNEEFRIAAVMDRVNTTWEAIMGTTFACTQCHGHPYEPFRHEDYYRFMAFFNNTRDEDTWEDYPALRHFSIAADSVKFLELQGRLRKTVPPEKAAEIELFIKTWQPACYSIAADSFTNCELYDTKWLTMRNHAVCRLKNIRLEGKNRLIARYWSHLDGGRWTVRLDSPDGPLLFSTAVKNTKGKREILSFDFDRSLDTAPPVRNLWFHYENPNLKKPEDAGMSFDWFHFTEPFPGNDKKAEADFWHLLRAESAFTPIMLENPADMKRETHVFERGNWLVKGKKVEPGVPNIFPDFPANAPKNRLGLAQWLTDKRHPLTSRVLANRLWEQMFGRGLVETLEDFGSQGMAPTHPELLDWLAWRLMHDHQWSMKSLMREIALSATYRQSSRVTPELLERDPDNRLYARGSRVRLNAEQLRDQVLQVSGLLSEKMYGSGVMPFQPYGVWQSPWNGGTWQQSKGEDQYRRAVYTYWKRSSPYPSALTFDGVAREVCVARRIRTNTPLQALVMLNDSVYVEAARHLALKISEEDKNEAVEQQIARLFEKATGQTITAPKLESLKKLYATAVESYRRNPAMRGEMTGCDPRYDAPETAALVLVANAVFNLDEFVCKN
ncbi:MAG: DUF1553 domain-containing protein [Haliscomenobacteraceae bacterium CHB4]|nr:DUF1553 domain-containing protein [Haliscomenobacteraceae bacterium CHB4]